MNVTRILLPLLLALSVASCIVSSPKPPEYDPVVLASGVAIKDLVIPDEGPSAEMGDRVSLHYELSLNDGTPIDSSYSRGTPIELVLGESELMPGLQEGVVGMRLFGRRKVVVPPELGYGEAGVPPRIPPKAILRVVVELMRLEAAGESDDPSRRPR